jgi:HD-GYP domain-containing protein (c-di-GMP phosphodiesterase class II)
MSLDRPYRKALSVDEIVAELKAGAGTRFDPHLVEVFVEVLQAERRAQAA